MTAVKAPRRGGRQKNKWTMITLKRMLGWIAANEIPQKAFAASLGITNSTFHNWKNERCAPDEDVQGKILDLINGMENITMANGNRAPRGAGSSTLAALTGSGKKKTKKKTKAKVAKKKKKTKKVAKKKIKKIKKKVGRVRSTKPRAKAKASSNGNGFGLDGWDNLEALGQFVRANEDRSLEEIGALVGTLQKVSKIFG
jgi:DNA-binding transcriptional regulator YiaG